MNDSFHGVESWESRLEQLQSPEQWAGPAHSALLVREFAEVRDEISHHLRRCDWERLVACLKRLSQSAEAGGYRGICLSAQSILEILGFHGAGRDIPGGRVLELCESLLGHLAHAEWREKEKIESLGLV